MNPIAAYYRQLLRITYGDYLHGNLYNGEVVTMDNLHAVADEWLAYMRFRKASGLKIKIPSRAYLIRSCS